ncbi:MAG: D-alanyl-D-alanine carboxypeptidase, partial [Gammaproteobacteria bacterium]
YFEYNDIKQPNRNRLLWRDSSVDGLKTGHTEEAGYCLVSSAVRNGMRLISVVMGTHSEEARARESQKLLAFGFRYYETGKVYAKGDVLQADTRVWYGVEDTVNLVAPNDVYLTIPRGAKDELQANVVVNDSIEAPLTDSQTLGRLTVSFEGEPLLETPLVSDRSVEQAGLFARLWDAITLFFMGIFS